MNWQRFGIIAAITGLVVAIATYLKKNPPVQVTVEQPNVGPNGVPAATPVTRVFNFGMGTGSSPYLDQNIPPLPDFSKEISDALNPGGCGCGCSGMNGKFQFTDGFSGVTTGLTRQIENVYSSKTDQKTIGTVAKQVADVPAPAVNQATGVFPDAYNTGIHSLDDVIPWATVQ
jgi:hypothetical protein